MAYQARSSPTPDPEPSVRGRHDHLWSLPDGTGLHVPPGRLAIEEGTGRVCCHLCGRWFTALGAHVRVHGYTADGYRAAMGLMRTRPLAAAGLSASISARQGRRYRAEPRVRDYFAAGQAMARSGQLAWRARAADSAGGIRPERARVRRDQLAQGREAAAARRDQQLAGRLAALGAASLPDYLRAASAAGTSRAELGRLTGLGQRRLRAALSAAGIAAFPSGLNTSEGKRSRAVDADLAAAQRVGTDDLCAWLRLRRSAGWTLTQLGAAVGHSSHWVRWRLERDATSRDRAGPVGRAPAG